MERFRDGQRVIVTRPDHPMVEKIGRVVRLRMSDCGAWVNMDDDLPVELRSFPSDDPHGRANHTILYPSECEAV